MQRTATQDEERGVYRSWWKRGGCHVVYAVDSRGDVLEKIIRLRPDVDEARAFQLMQEELDRVDPVPVLRLVSEPAPASAPRMLSVAQLDALYREHADPVSALLYLRKRERLRRALR